jgi:hypothetical protein
MKRLEKLEELDDEGDESDDEKCNDTDLTTDEEKCTENTDEELVGNKLRYEQLKQALFRRKQQDEVAITGEITLEGKVTAIGGLEEKLVGAKKAGVKLALIPRENEKHLLKVNERNPTLIDDEFKVIMIDTLNDALKHSLL